MDIKIPSENLSISEVILSIAAEHPYNTAISYQNRRISYKKLYENILNLAEALYSAGIRQGDIVLVALPNIPRAVYLLYALNRIGASAAFVSPLSAEAELEEYINKCDAKLIVALDTLYTKLLNVFERTGDKNLVLVSIFEETEIFFGRKKSKAVYWHRFIKNRCKNNIFVSPSKPQDTAVILFSGGTTGKPKAVEITNLNLNALAKGTGDVCGECVKGAVMLAVLPVFHGFGLGICIHTTLFFGGECILVPRFDARKIGRIICRKKSLFIAAVPAMLTPLMTAKSMGKADLSKLRGVFCGGDCLESVLEKDFNNFLESHNSNVRIRQGYGLTECVAASCLMPKNSQIPGSVGQPYPETMYKIVNPETLEEVSRGTVGEICISSKTVMKGYLKDKSATDETLKLHRDGRCWLSTGDLGYMDEDGYVYFVRRLKRLIVTNGHNVYPSELERILSSNPLVAETSAVGVRDLRKAQVAVMFVVLKNPSANSRELKSELMLFLKSKISKHALPADIYFVSEIPKTPLGKVSYGELEQKADSLYNKNDCS